MFEADVIDRAARQADELLAGALAAHKRRDASAGKTAADSAHDCAQCGEPIPEARRRAVPGVQCCVDCQRRRERWLGARRER